MTFINEFAPAKLNLYLHITGRRDDGFHDLDSLIAFATVGDEVRVQAADHFSFKIEGPQASALDHEDPDTNLAVKAARSLAELTGHELNIALRLVKRLPVASGIGGGSSDAAAVLRALARHWGLSVSDARVAEAASRHGQDVPVCLKVENNYMTAAGVIAAPHLPCADIVLVNPGKGLPTPEVYKEYRKGADGFSPLSRLQEAPRDVGQLASVLLQRGNDLYAPACRLMPEIGRIVAALKETQKCLLGRMSGSGATCFGLYADAASAADAAAQIRVKHPSWWVEVGRINA